MLDAGSGNSTATWRHVQAEVAKLTWACAYDWASLDFSDAAERPSDLVNIVDDLRRLGKAADLPPRSSTSAIRSPAPSASSMWRPIRTRSPAPSWRSRRSPRSSTDAGGGSSASDPGGEPLRQGVVGRRARGKSKEDCHANLASCRHRGPIGGPVARLCAIPAAAAEPWDSWRRRRRRRDRRSGRRAGRRGRRRRARSGVGSQTGAVPSALPPAPPVAYNGPIAVGAKIPRDGSVPTYFIPNYSHRYAYTNLDGHEVIVNRRTARIVQVMP